MDRKNQGNWIFDKKEKYGGTYAHKDIAFEFCFAISPIFKLFWKNQGTIN